MNKLIAFSGAVAIVFSMTFCHIEPCEDELIEPKVKILGHRGTGTDSYWLKDPSLPRQNTLGAMLYAFHYLNGAEADIQMSANGTIWLWHDDYIGDAANCIPCMSDEQIMEQLPQGQSLVKLVDVLALLKSYPNKKYLSLDVKGYFPSCDCFDHTQYFDRMSDSIATFCNRLQITNRVMVETNYTRFLNLMREKQPSVDCYFLGYSDMRATIATALENGYQGISFNYSDSSFTPANMKYLRSNKLKIQAWSIYSQQGLDICYEYGVDFIQTGFFGFLPRK